MPAVTSTADARSSRPQRGNRPPPLRPTVQTRRRRRHARALLAGVAVVAVVAAPSGRASSQWIGSEQEFTNLLNQERLERGLPALDVNLQLVRIARAWSQTMANDARLTHRPDLADQVHGPWSRLGENIGSGRTVTGLHDAFMSSAGHRSNILGPYTHVGVGVVTDGDNTIWVTVNFLSGPDGQFPLFSDIHGSPHERSIEAIWLSDIATGCRFDRFCPHDPVTRAQMATFIGRALDIRPLHLSRFADVDPRSPHAGYINALAEAGITAGCDDSARQFCPNDAVRRDQLATFLMRARREAESRAPHFVDVLPASTHYGYVNSAAEKNVTGGCDSTEPRYCPHYPVTRGQMASFLSRAFSLSPSFWHAQPTATASSPVARPKTPARRSTSREQVTGPGATDGRRVTGSQQDLLRGAHDIKRGEPHR